MILVLLLLLCFGLTGAEKPLFPQGVEFPLLSTNEGFVTKSLVEAYGVMGKSAGRACGKYFFLPDENRGRNANDGYIEVLFEFVVGKNKKGELVGASVMGGRNKFFIIADPDLDRPAIIYLGKRGSQFHHWTVHMTEKDAEETRPCLPAPAPKTEPLLKTEIR